VLSEKVNDENGMELRQLKTFLTVSRLLSFNRAAESLHYAQSTVSAQIKALEDELGVSLFDRLGKKVILTEAGELLTQYARKMRDLETATLSQVSGREDPRGSLSIRMPQSLGTCFLPAVLSQFHRKYPRVRFDISSCAAASLQQELRMGIYDVAFLLAESINAADLKAEVLGFARLVMVSAPDHHLAARSLLSLSDLSGQTLLAPKFDCSYKMMFEQELLQARVNLEATIEINSVETLIRCVMKGIGITVLPGMIVAGHIAAGQLAQLSLFDGHLETAILMITHKDKWISPALRAFMEAFRVAVKRNKMDHDMLP
jgi:DNA-binding transcriptional LysR family regulator